MADWTINDPLLTSMEVVTITGRTVINAIVQFRGDAGETFDKTYQVHGSNALETLRRRVFEDRNTLQASGSFIPAMEVDPLAGTPMDIAIQAYTVAVQQHKALNALATLMGWVDGTTIGTSGRTVAQVRTSLRNTIVADMSNDNRIAIALSNFPL